MLQRRLELCGEAPRAPMQPCKRRVRPPTGSPPAHGRSPPEQGQSEKTQGVRGTDSPDSFDNKAKKPRITCPFFRGKYTSSIKSFRQRGVPRVFWPFDSIS